LTHVESIKDLLSEASIFERVEMQELLATQSLHKSLHNVQINGLKAPFSIEMSVSCNCVVRRHSRGKALGFVVLDDVVILLLTESIEILLDVL
jgi:hypothetical protein